MSEYPPIRNVIDLRIRVDKQWSSGSDMEIILVAGAGPDGRRSIDSERLFNAIRLLAESWPGARFSAVANGHEVVSIVVAKELVQ